MQLHTKEELLHIFAGWNVTANIPTKKLDTIISNPVYMPSYIIKLTALKSTSGKKLYSIQKL